MFLQNPLLQISFLYCAGGEDSSTIWELETYFIYQLGSFFCEEKCNARKSCQRGKKTSLLCFYLYSLFPEKWDCLDLGHGEWKIEKIAQ